MKCYIYDTQADLEKVRGIRMIEKEDEKIFQVGENVTLARYSAVVSDSWRCDKCGKPNFHGLHAFVYRNWIQRWRDAMTE